MHVTPKLGQLGNARYVCVLVLVVLAKQHHAARFEQIDVHSECAPYDQTIINLPASSKHHSSHLFTDSQLHGMYPCQPKPTCHTYVM